MIKGPDGQRLTPFIAAKIVFYEMGRYHHLRNEDEVFAVARVDLSGSTSQERKHFAQCLHKTEARVKRLFGL